MTACAWCGPKSSRAVLHQTPHGALCGRCYAAGPVRETAEYRKRAAASQIRRRMRLGGKSTRWVAYRRGEPVGVYSTEARALQVSNVVRAFRVDQVPPK